MLDEHPQNRKRTINGRLAVAARSHKVDVADDEFFCDVFAGCHRPVKLQLMQMRQVCVVRECRKSVRLGLNNGAGFSIKITHLNLLDLRKKGPKIAKNISAKTPRSFPQTEGFSGRKIGE